MSNIHHAAHQSKTQPGTQEFLRLNPLPRHLAHLQPTIEQLPLSLLTELALGSVVYGLDDAAFVAALRSAVEFQEQAAWRCPACHSWQRRANLIIAAIAGGNLQFYSLCVRCEKRYQTVDAVMDACRGYVTEGAR